jgi:SAM-dependent methyltransferase
MFYNTTYAHLWKQQLTFRCNPKDPTEQFIEGWWFVGVSVGNISPLYGSYQIEYLERIKTLFPDAVKVVHLFVGSLPPSPDYVRVGLSQGDTKPDIECDAHQLSSYLPFKADLIYADPPYSVEDSEHYDNSMVNRERVLQECALVLEPGGFLVWMDQALPVFNNNDLRLVGGISYIRSTGNRFRVVTIFQKPICQSTKSEPKLLNTNSTNQAEFV